MNDPIDLAAARVRRYVPVDLGTCIGDGCDKTAWYYIAHRLGASPQLMIRAGVDAERQASFHRKDGIEPLVVCPEHAHIALDDLLIAYARPNERSQP